MKRVLFLSLLIVFVVNFHLTASERFALVIGNSKYENVSPLENPKHDAAAIAKSLEPLGFDVTLQNDLDLRNMKKIVSEFRKKLSEDSLAFFYYAGHGIQVKGTNYLIPIGVEISSESEVEFECINLNRIMGVLNDSDSKLNVIVLDSCRNNPFKRSWTRSTPSDGLAAIEKVPDGTLVAFSTSPGQPAIDTLGTSKNSPYTEELAEVLKSRPEGGLEIVDVFRTASQEVKKATGQRPWLRMDASMERYFLWKEGDVFSNTGRDLVLKKYPKPEESKRPSNVVEPIFDNEVKRATYIREFDILGKQANIYKQNGDYENAIRAYSTIIEDPTYSIEVRKLARLGRGATYLSRKKEGDLDLAIIDQKAAGLKGIQVTVRADTADLKTGTTVHGKVRRGQVLLITHTNKDWLWVDSVNGDSQLRGWVQMAAIFNESNPIKLPQNYINNNTPTKGKLFQQKEKKGLIGKLLFGNKK